MMQSISILQCQCINNLIEYSDNYSGTSGSLWQFKRDEQPINNNGGFINPTAENFSSFKYKSNLIGDLVADGANEKKEDVKIAVPLKHLSNFGRSLEIPLINCKIELSLKWYENCILSSVGTAVIFAITDTKTLCSSCYFKNWRQCKIINIIKRGI